MGTLLWREVLLISDPGFKKLARRVCIVRPDREWFGRVDRANRITGDIELWIGLGTGLPAGIQQHVTSSRGPTLGLGEHQTP
eukprot:1018850-Amphidinium_carterae.1